MKVYVSTEEESMAGMVAQEDQFGEERAIYYLSRQLTKCECNYSAIEKLCLALYFTCTKLRAYLRPVTVYLISKVNLVKYMSSRPILHQRVGLWTLALLEFEIQYIPQKAVKNHALANFLANHQCLDMPEEIELEINSFELKPWILYFDGSKTSKSAGVGVTLINHLGIC